MAVINARFIKPLDRELLARVFQECRFVVTAEEGALMGGFGSAVLELACHEGWDTRGVKTLGISDQFVEHGDRNELLADFSLDPHGIANVCRQLAQRFSNAESTVSS